MSPKSSHRSQSQAGQPYVAVGRVLASRGLGGEVKVRPLTDRQDLFEAGQELWVMDARRRIETAGWHKGHVYLKLSGIDSTEAAEKLRGQSLSLPEALLGPLPKGHFYHFQIVGMQVYDGTGRHLGQIREVLTTGGNDVYVVWGEQGEILVPAIDDVVKEVDVVAGRMVVEPMEGMLPG
jgi:16S rRNA processing protein RimM